MPEEWITVQEAAIRFNRTTAWIYQLIRDQEIHARKPDVGRVTFIDAEELKRKLEPKPYQPGSQHG